MAQKTQITLVDDIDGSAADETVTFSVDGSTYEIDLTAAHAAQLRDVFVTYASHGRRTSSTRRTRGASRSSREAGRDYEPAAVRTWAEQRGIDVPSRGRIPGAVLDQYRAAR